MICRRRENGVRLSFFSQVLRQHINSLDVLPPSVKRIPRPGVSWWPSALKGNLDVKKIRAAGFELYMIERPATSVDPEIYLMAIDWHKNRGFIYTK